MTVPPATGAIGLVIAIATFAIVWGVSLILFGPHLRKIGRSLQPAWSARLRTFGLP